MTDAIVILCTVPNREVADKLARLLVEKRAAACVNILGEVTSVYRWKGEVTTDVELQLVIKTTSSQFAHVETLVRANHPYEVPELIALPVSLASSDYLTWLTEASR